MHQIEAVERSKPLQSQVADSIDQWSLIAAVKDEEVLQGTLLRSPAIDNRCQVITKHGYSSAAKAFNQGILEATNEIIVFAHTDVYLPDVWLSSLSTCLGALSRIDPNWGVLGVCGRSKAGDIAGHVYSTGLAAAYGNPLLGLVETLSLDEVLLVTRRSAGLKFDENLPGFHLYGTDICYEARRRGMKSYVISAFCIHNSNGVQVLPLAFWRSYFYLRSKWWAELPIHSCCTQITKPCGPFIRAAGTALRQLVLPSKVGTRSLDPEKLYRELIDSKQ
jgi:Glycosyltransferase like family